MKRWLALLLACLASPALGDVVHLNNGTTLEGQVRRTRDGYIITDASGKVTTITSTDVTSIELKKPAPGRDAAAEQLESLRRSLERVADPAVAVQRYAKFISEHPGSPAAAQAGQEMGQWQERADKGLRRVGKRWGTKDELVRILSEVDQAAGQAAGLIGAGKTSAASDILQKALVLAPEDPMLLYLKGLVLFQQDRLVPARQAFEGVAKELPDHAPTHNNLAVILWKTRALIPALAEYDKALSADPGNRTILDNVAEALHALPETYRKNQITKKLVSRFDDLDAEMQKKMAKQGLYRLGSQWVPADDFKSFHATQANARERMDSYKNDSLTLQTRLMQIDRTIDDDMHLMNSILQEQTQVVRSYDYDSLTGAPTPNGQGPIRQYPLPQRYFDLEKEVVALKAEKATKTRQLQQLPRLVADAQKNADQKCYTGTQNLIGLDSAPGTIPATQPSTQPGDF